MRTGDILPCLAIVALAALASAGCAYQVVQPAPLTVSSPQEGPIREVRYPAYILVHDSESFWDAHQIKDNLVGLTEGEVVHWADLAIRGITFGHSTHAIENSIEWIKNEYAQVPQKAPVRIVGGFFAALGIEKTTLLTGATRIALAPEDPLSYFVFTRVIYLTDWVQNTLGEINAGAGHLVPWPGAFIPQAATRPVNRGVDWAQEGAITAYIWVVRKLNLAADRAISAGERAYGAVVWVFIRHKYVDVKVSEQATDR